MSFYGKNTQLRHSFSSAWSDPELLDVPAPTEWI